MFQAHYRRLLYIIIILLTIIIIIIMYKQCDIKCKTEVNNDLTGRRSILYSSLSLIINHWLGYNNFVNTRRFAGTTRQERYDVIILGKNCFRYRMKYRVFSGVLKHFSLAFSHCFYSRLIPPFFCHLKRIYI